MRNQRSFRLEFKRQVVEELLSGQSRPAQLCCRYNITSSVLYHWKKQYNRGNPVSSTGEPTEEGALQDRIEKLERLVGRLTLENEFLKKGLQHSRSIIGLRRVGDSTARNRQVGWIDFVAIHPDYQHRGVCRGLVEAFGAECKRNNAEMRTRARESNEGMKNFLASVGFRKSSLVTYVKD